jgi:hypothetical protein
MFLPRKVFPRNYLPRNYLSRNYFPIMFLQIKFFHRKYISNERPQFQFFFTRSGNIAELAVSVLTRYIYKSAAWRWDR